MHLTDFYLKPSKYQQLMQRVTYDHLRSLITETLEGLADALNGEDPI